MSRLTQTAHWIKTNKPFDGLLRHRPMVCCTVSIIAGILLARQWSAFEWAWTILPFAVFGLIWALQHVKRKCALAAAVILFFAAGYCRAIPYFWTEELPQVGKWTVEGVISTPIHQSKKGIWFDLNNVQIRQEDSCDFGMKGKLYCFVWAGKAEDYSYGQKVRVTGDGSLPEAQRNENDFNQKEWFLQRNVKASVFTYDPPEILGEAGFSLLGTAYRIQNALSERMDLLFGEVSPVVRAMVLGDTQGLTDEIRGWFESGGISHLLAVSGLHVCFWFLLIDGALSFVPIRKGSKLAIAAVALVVYLFLTGLKASAIRAAVMLLISKGAGLTGKRNDSLTTLAAAALILLLFRPMDLFSASFQLSFASVGGLILLGLSTRFKTDNKIFKGFATTMGAQLGTIPLVSKLYGSVSAYSLLTNLAAVPLAGILIPLTAATIAISYISMPAGYLIAELSRGLAWLLTIIGRIAQGLPGSKLMLPRFNAWMYILWYAALLLCSNAALWNWKKRTAALTAMAMIFTFLTISGNKHDALRYVQLDVGEALSGVLEIEDTCVVFDCGKSGSALAPYLLEQREDVDALFLSHVHADHVGGLADVLESGITVKSVYVPAKAEAWETTDTYEEAMELLREYDVPVAEVSAGDEIQVDSLIITVITPKAEVQPLEEPNDRCISVLTEIKGKKLLLCADVDGAEEPAVDCDIVQIAHHGSANAADGEVLSTMTPKIALLSVGRNGYGHPDADMLERLKNSGAEIYSTWDSGAIYVYFDEEEPRVETFIP